MTTEAFYIECSLPTGVTIAEYRRSRPKRPTLWQRLARPHFANANTAR